MTAPAARREMLAPLRIQSFRMQFAAQAISMAGSTLSPVALALGVLQLGGSASTLSWVLAAQALPFVLFLLVGGVWADRLPRHLLMVGANLIAAVTQAVVGVMLITGEFHLATVVVLQFLGGTAMAFYFPAVGGLTAQLVPPSRLQQANALLSLTRSIAGSLGPLIAGLLVVSIGAGWALAADSATFVISALCLVRISAVTVSRRLEPRGDKQSFMRDLAQGFREVIRRNWVWTSIGAFMFSHLATAIFLVLAPVTLLSRGHSPLVWGAVVAFLSIGQIVGDVLALRLTPQRPIVAARLVELLSVPLLAALAIDASVPLLLGAALAAGVALTFPDALWYTALQQHLPSNVLSRVSSYDWLGSFTLRPIGFLTAAIFADQFGAAATLLAAAACVCATRLAGLLFSDVRNLPSATAPIRQETVV